MVLNLLSPVLERTSTVMVSFSMGLGLNFFISTVLLSLEAVQTGLLLSDSVQCLKNRKVLYIFKHSAKFHEHGA